MALTITQSMLDHTDLVVLVSPDGLVQWSSHRDPADVADMLRKIAADIEDGILVTRAPQRPSIRPEPCPDTMTVTVRDTAAEPWGHGLTRPITRTVTISAWCPHPGCGQRRGAPRGANLCDDGAYYWVQQWDNPCGHTDYYPQVLAEARQRQNEAS